MQLFHCGTKLVLKEKQKFSAQWVKVSGFI